MKENPYQVLDLAPGASEREIRKAYRRKIKLYHPDCSQAPDAEERCREINEAYETLRRDGIARTGGTLDDLTTEAIRTALNQRSTLDITLDLTETMIEESRIYLFASVAYASVCLIAAPYQFITDNPGSGLALYSVSLLGFWGMKLFYPAKVEAEHHRDQVKSTLHDLEQQLEELIQRVRQE